MDAKRVEYTRVIRVILIQIYLGPSFLSFEREPDIEAKPTAKKTESRDRKKKQMPDNII